MRECACGDVQYRKHNWKLEYDQSPTHLAEGERRYSCSGCGATKTEYISKLEEHQFDGNWTYSDEYEHKCECPCGEVEYQGHWYDLYEIVKEPTYGEDGIGKYTCSACGAEKFEYIEKLPDEDITGGPFDTGYSTDRPSMSDQVDSTIEEEPTTSEIDADTDTDTDSDTDIGADTDVTGSEPIDDDNNGISGCEGTLSGQMLLIALIPLLFACIIAKKKQQ